MPSLHWDRLCDLCGETIDFRIIPCHLCGRIHHLICIENGWHGTFDWIWKFENLTQRFEPTLLYVCRACSAERLRNIVIEV